MTCCRSTCLAWALWVVVGLMESYWGLVQPCRNPPQVDDLCPRSKLATTALWRNFWALTTPSHWYIVNMHAPATRPHTLHIMQSSPAQSLLPYGTRFSATTHLLISYFTRTKALSPYLPFYYVQTPFAVPFHLDQTLHEEFKVFPTSRIHLSQASRSPDLC